MNKVGSRTAAVAEKGKKANIPAHSVTIRSNFPGRCCFSKPPADLGPAP
jgi:hypothetical protein